MEPTRIAYGTWSGGRFMHFGSRLDEDPYCDAIRLAYDKGIRTFMTADVYGEGEADAMLGRALQDFPRDSYCLVGAIGHDFYEGQRAGSKGFPRFTDPALRGESAYADYVRMATEKSLQRCGHDAFDLLMLHNPDAIGYTSEAVWRGMEQLRDEGLARLIGIAPGPANGFTLDLIGCFDKFGSSIDWAMVILNPLEPWPGGLCLPAADKNGVKVMTRVVDYGGLFHDDVKPGHTFGPMDHRMFRPAGWVEQGCEKVERMRGIAEGHGLTMLQLACGWNLAQPAVESVIPTIIQEAGSEVRPIGSKIADLAALPDSVALTREECETIFEIGNNKGCMPLKGGSRQYMGKPQADQWTLTEDLEEVARRWKINPDVDLYCSHDPRDLREKGMPKRGVPQTTNRRLFVQLQVFTGARDPGEGEQIIDAVRGSGLDAVVYADVNDPRGFGVLVMSEDPSLFVGSARELFGGEAFAELTHNRNMTMLGRTYGFGREPDVEQWLLRRPLEHALNPDWPWAVWYPLRRKGSFYRLTKPEQTEILKEHGSIGFNYGGAGYAGDIRLECFGLNRDDNEFVLGLMSPELVWLSKLVEEMRPTVQTSQYMDQLGPFFVGKAIYQSAL